MHSFVFSALANFLVLLALWSGVEASHTHVLNMSSTYCSGVFGRFAQAKDPRQIQISKEESAASRYRLQDGRFVLPLKLPFRFTLKILNFLLETADG